MSTRLYSRNAVLLAKIEGTEGLDAEPTGTSNAVLVSELSIQPLAGSELDLAYIRPYMGISPSIRVEDYVTASFTVDFAGVATAGTAPAWGPLLRACGFAETLVASGHATLAGTAQAADTTTVTLSSSTASTTNGAYVGCSITMGSQTRTIIAYVGSTKVATLSKAWTASAGSYTITPSATYLPISTAFEALTLYYNINGVRHKMIGAKGSVSIDQIAKQRPALKFSFTGGYGGVADANEATPVYTAFQTPQTINSTNTSGLLAGKQCDGSVTGFQLMSLSLDMANAVTYRQLVGAQSVVLTDRQPRGSVSIEATTVTFKDFFGEIRSSTKYPLLIENGLTAGNTTALFMPNAQLAEPAYSDSDGIVMLDMSVRALPSVANDEVRIVVK